MSSSLRVNTIVPSTGTNVAIGTANGTVTFTDSVNFVLGTGSSIFSPASNTLTFGTNDEERLRITSDGKVGINQASPGAMLQVDYDEGNSQVALRLRAYNASGSKTWQLSEINGNAGVFSIRNQTNSTEGLEIHADGHLRVPTGDLRVGDNTDSNAGTKTISVGSVSSGSGGIGIFANPTNGNSFVQFGDGTSSADQYRGYMNYRHADDSLRFGTANTDRLHIDANGRIGIGTDVPTETITLNHANGASIGLEYGGSEHGTINVNSAAMYVLAGTGKLLILGGNATEALRITSGGDVGIGDNAPNSNYGTNLSVHSTATDGARLKLSDGTSGKGNTDGFDLISTGGVAYILNRENADMSFSTNNTEGMRLYANGKIHLGNSHIASNNLTRLHVGWNTGGTVAGESIIAGTLGNNTTAVSALLTMKNAGNRGALGASGGSSLAKFEFNNGTAFEIDKYGRRTLQYQPAARLTIDTNGTGGGNYAQTGITILPFNNTNRGYNTGNHFNTTNHTFTAPIAGKYLVIVSVNVIGDTILYIYKNGSAHSAGEFRSNPTGAWEHTEISSIIEMSANDTIQAYSYLVTSSGGRKFNGGTNPGSVWDHMSIYFMG